MMSETVFFFKNFFFCPSRNSCHDENSALYLLWCQSSFQLTVGISVQKGSPLHTRAMGAIGVPSLTYLPAAGFDTSIFLFPISWQKMSHVYSENYICLDFFFFNSMKQDTGEGLITVLVQQWGWFSERTDQRFKTSSEKVSHHRTCSQPMEFPLSRHWCQILQGLNLLIISSVAHIAL